MCTFGRVVICWPSAGRQERRQMVRQHSTACYAEPSSEELIYLYLCLCLIVYVGQVLHGLQWPGRQEGLLHQVPVAGRPHHLLRYETTTQAGPSTRTHVYAFGLVMTCVRLVVSFFVCAVLQWTMRGRQAGSATPAATSYSEEREGRRRAVYQGSFFHNLYCETARGVALSPLSRSAIS